MMGRGASVIVVDDDPIALQITRDRLEAMGCAVMTRSAALGTLEAVLRQRPDCVLLDVNMPALSGGGLAQLLKRGRSRQDVCIILHSGLPKHELDMLVLECGADGAIQKTSDDSAFTQAFCKLIQRSRVGSRP